LEDFVFFEDVPANILEIPLQPIDRVEHMLQVRKVSRCHRIGLRFSREWSPGSEGLAPLR
jgi:hypothetical protein